MSDVFISYNRADKAKAEQLARALTSHGWTVWWDPKILPGERFDTVIQHELEAARCVVVLWSANSVKSRWVRDEADVALKNGKLLPALIENVEVPMGFRAIEAANLVDWKGETGHSEYVNLKAAIQKKLAPSIADPLWSKARFPLLGAGTSTSILDLLNVKSQPSPSYPVDYPKSGLSWNFSEISKAKPLTGIIFEDHFDDNKNGWLEKRDHERILMRVRAGSYRLEHQGEGSWFTWKPIAIDPARDFRIDVQIVHHFASTAQGYPYYGVIWGGADIDNLYSLLLSYDGQFSYQKKVGGVWQPVISWRKCYCFHDLAKAEGRNQITLQKKSKVVEFRLNDTWLEDADFENFFGNNTGFAICRRFTIDVKSLKVTQE